MKDGEMRRRSTKAGTVVPATPPIAQVLVDLVVYPLNEGRDRSPGDTTKAPSANK